MTEPSTTEPVVKCANCQTLHPSIAAKCPNCGSVEILPTAASDPKRK